MANYIDGFIVPVPKKNLAAYRKVAKLAGKIWMEYGALQYMECVGDDTPKGKLTSFPRSVQLKPSEVVFFSWIVYKSKADRNRIMKLVMSDKRIENLGPAMMPFDGKRMIYGGFKPMVVY